MINSYFIKENTTKNNLINVLFLEKSVFVRFFSESDENISDIPENLFITDSELQEIGFLEKKYYLYDDNLFIIKKQQEYTIPANMWQNYSQVCLLVSPLNARAAFINNYAHTYVSKDTFSSFKDQMKVSGSEVLAEWIVLPNTNLLTAPHILRTQNKLITNITCDEIIDYSDDMQEALSEKAEEFRNYYLPQVTIDGPSEITADSFAEFTVNCTHSTAEHEAVEHEYEVQCIQGYAPNTRVTVKDGKGSFKIYATGLVKGDTLRFKINDKFWTDKAEKTLTVI